MYNCNQLKERALNILLTETFSYVEQNMHNAYIQLAIENKKVKGITQHGNTVFFMYQGCVYPKYTPGGLPVQTFRVNAPILHYSLIEKFDQIQCNLDTSGYTSIKNFFSIVLSRSFNNIVLDTFLPTILITKLRKELTDEEYRIIDAGSAHPLSIPESIEQTQQQINMIKEHYHNSINLLRELLMERFLLQG